MQIRNKFSFQEYMYVDKNSVFGTSGFLNSFTCGENLIILFRILESTNKSKVGVPDLPAGGFYEG